MRAIDGIFLTNATASVHSISLREHISLPLPTCREALPPPSLAFHKTELPISNQTGDT